MTGLVQPVYTVPADRTAIIKDARMRLQGAAGSIAVFVLAGGGSVVLMRGNPAGGDVDVVADDPWCVLREGESLSLFGPTVGATADLWISGALLAGDPA